MESFYPNFIFRDTVSEISESRQKIDGYLEKLNIKPVKVIEEEKYLTYVIKVELDFGEIELEIRFKIESPRWVEFKTIFLKELNPSVEVYEKILELNFATILTRFGIDDKTVYAKIELPFPTLDYEEFFSAIKRIANDVNNYFPLFGDIIHQ